MTRITSQSFTALANPFFRIGGTRPSTPRDLTPTGLLSFLHNLFLTFNPSQVESFLLVAPQPAKKFSNISAIRKSFGTTPTQGITFWTAIQRANSRGKLLLPPSAGNLSALNQKNPMKRAV